MYSTQDSEWLGVLNACHYWRPRCFGHCSKIGAGQRLRGQIRARLFGRTPKPWCFAVVEFWYAVNTIVINIILFMNIHYIKDPSPRKRASFKEYCETLRKARDEWNLKLYYKLIKVHMKFGLRKTIVDHFVQGNIVKKGWNLTPLWRHKLENSSSVIIHYKLYTHSSFNRAVQFRRDQRSSKSTEVE